jgi:hypothetical protein
VIFSSHFPSRHAGDSAVCEREAMEDGVQNGKWMNKE